MLDRVWWLWQMQDPENRVDKVPGAGAMSMPGLGMKEERQDLENAVVDLGWTAPAVKLLELNEMLGGLGGQFCYVYV